MKSKSLFLLLTTFALTGCGGNGGATSSQTTSTVSTTETTSSTVAPVPTTESSSSTVAPIPIDHNVTEDEYNAAFRMINEGNVKANVYKTGTNGIITEEMNIHLEATATKLKLEITGTFDSLIQYMSHEGEKYYEFAETIHGWYKIEIPKEQYDSARYSGVVFQLSFDNLKFDSETGKYVLKKPVTEQDVDIVTITSKADHLFEDKKLMSLDFTITESVTDEPDVIKTGIATYEYPGETFDIDMPDAQPYPY